MKNSYVSLSIDKVELNELLHKINLIDSNIPYVIYEGKFNDDSIRIYKNKKGDLTLLLNGQNPNNTLTTLLPNHQRWLSTNEQIGSDEVGVGDFVLPLIVVASYIDENTLQLIEKLGIKDSKQLSDERIKKIGPLLIDKVSFSKLTLSNEKYNEMINKGENINTLKAKMHNKALLNLVNKHKQTKEIYVDQFVNNSKYFEYLKGEKEVVKNIIFKTKGESYYPSVALSSVIARYAFLLEKEKLENRYKTIFPKGINTQTIDFSIKFIKKFGLAEFNKICKIDFKTYRDILLILSK